MNIEIKGLDTGVTMITLEYLGKKYTTGCFFSEEVGEKVQLLVEAALDYENKKQTS